MRNQWSSSSSLLTSLTACGFMFAVGVAHPPRAHGADCATLPPALVSWWTAEGAATDVADGNNGVLHNGATFAPGIVGQAFSFNGTGAHVRITDQLNLHCTNAITLEAWVKPTAHGGYHTIMAKWDVVPGINQKAFAIALDPSGKAYWGVSPNGTDWPPSSANSTSVIPLNAWTHLAGTYDGTATRLYVNGVLEGQAPYSLGILSSTDDLAIGGYVGGGFPGEVLGPFAGLIDEPSLYSRALSQSEIQAIYNAGSAGKCSGPIPPFIVSQPTNQTVLEGRTALFVVEAGGTPPLSYQWLFNSAVLDSATNRSLLLTNVQLPQAGSYAVMITNAHGSTNSAGAELSVTPLTTCAALPQGLVGWWQGEGNSWDAVGGNSATLVGGATYAPGKVGSTFSFQGASAYALIADSPSLRFTNAVTVEVWIRPNIAAPRPREIVSKWEGASNQRSYTLKIYPSGEGSFGISHSGGPNSASVLGNTVIAANEWSHLAAVYDGSALEIYLNGVLDGTAPYSQGIFPGTVPLTIGSTITSGSYFDGLIDEPSLYNRALSATEIQAIYEAGIAGKCVEPILPFITMHPTNQIVVAGSSVVFVAGAGGTPPLNYQWRFNGTNLPGATAAVLNLTNVDSSNMGTYAVSVSNHVGGVSSAPVVLDVRCAVAYGNGMLLTGSNYTYVGSVDLQLWTVFPSGSVFYTLDGSAPSFLSAYYFGPFDLRRSGTLRAITYSADFSQSWEAPAIELAVIPLYDVTATTRGGGSVALNPPTGPYVSNTVVTATATPAAGWTFLEWLGDTSDANPQATLTVNRPLRLEAVFGTTLGMTVTGNGAVLVDPVSPQYPFGTVARLTAVPAAGNAFAVWGNAASGAVNPLYFTVTNPAPIVSSLFAPLGAGQHALTVVAEGRGRVLVNPPANSYGTGVGVTLTAVPEAGQTFLGWGGDATGSQNPLGVTMNASKVIAASFSRRPAIAVEASPAVLGAEGCRLSLQGEYGAVYVIQTSSNLTDWTSLVTLTNTYGRAQFADGAASQSPHRFYRALME